MWRNRAVLTTFRRSIGAASEPLLLSAPTECMNDLFDKSRRHPDVRVIAIRGVREHNLKNVDLEIPRPPILRGAHTCR